MWSDDQARTGMQCCVQSLPLLGTLRSLAPSQLLRRSMLNQRTPRNNIPLQLLMTRQCHTSCLIPFSTESSVWKDRDGWSKSGSCCTYNTNLDIRRLLPAAEGPGHLTSHVLVWQGVGKAVTPVVANVYLGQWTAP
jgi:hypothetical protein